METLIAFLSPSFTIDKIKERVLTILAQMERPLDSIPYDVPHHQRLNCNLCGNCSESNFVIDHSQGFTICQGWNPEKGCGNVIYENMYGDDTIPYEQDDFSNNNEFFSPVSSFPSTMIRANNRMQRLNRCIEKNLNRYGRDDTVTSDAYKDKQRQEAYNMLESLNASCLSTRCVLQVFRSSLTLFAI